MKMNFILGWIIALSAVLSHAEPTIDYADAEAVINEYFTALEQGDTQSLLQLMGPEEQANSDFLKTDPGYSSWLVNHYQGANFKITKRSRQNDFIAFDVLIDIGGDENVQERIILKSTSSNGTGPYKIIRRIEL